MADGNDPNGVDNFECDVPTAFKLPPPGRESDLRQYPVLAPLPEWPEALRPKPRLILTPDRIEAIRQDIETGFLKDLWPRLWEMHRRHHNLALESFSKPTRDHAHAIIWRALRWCLVRDVDCLEDLARYLQAISRTAIFEHRISLTPSELLTAVALALDWAGDALPAETTAAARRWLAVQAAQMARAAEARAVWWADCLLQNHFVVDECGIGLAGMALADAPEEDLRSVALDLYRHALVSFRKAVYFQPPDGSSPEFPRYAFYMFENQFIFFEALRSFSGEDLYGRFARRRIDYIIHQLVPSPDPVEGDVLNFGDNQRSSAVHPPTGLLYALARRFRNGLAQGAADWLVRRGVGIDRNKNWTIPIHRDPSLEPAEFPPADDSLPKSYHAEDQGLVIMRSSWTDEDATMLALLCGPFQGHRLRRLADRDMGAAHRHPDNGSFQVYAGKTYLVVDPGYELLKSTANHNTVLVDGKGQTGEGNMWLNVNNCLCREGEPLHIAKFEDMGQVCYLVAELAGAYDPDLQLTRFRRRIIYLRPDWIFVHDDLQSEVPHEYHWLLHTDPETTFTDLAAGHWRIDAQRVGLDIRLLWPEIAEVDSRSELHRIARSRFVKTTRRLVLSTKNRTCSAEFLVAMKVIRKGEDETAAQISASRSDRTITVTGGDFTLEWPIEPTGEVRVAAGQKADP